MLNPILRKSTLLGAVVALLLFAATAHADTIVFNNAPGTGSQQGYLLGMDFIVNSPVSVTQLGAFDSLGDGFSNTIQVGIFDVNGSATTPLVSTTLTGSGDTLVAGSRFKPITPFLLGPGTYSIVAVGFTGLDFSGNSQSGEIDLFNNAGGSLTLINKGGRWDTTADFKLPTANSGGYGQSDPVFQAGTFAVAVPDGGSAAMLLGFGLLATAWIRRRFL